MRIKSWVYKSARNLYRGRRAVSLQTFTTRHSNRKLSIVMAVSTNQKRIYDFLLVINTNLPPILHRFGDTSFQRWKIAILATPLAFKLPDGGVPLGRAPWNFPWMSLDGQGTKWRWKIAENFNRLSRVHQRYRQTVRRQTDGTAIAYSERERELTFAKNDLQSSFQNGKRH